jgi:hypothetical protein
MKELSEKLIAHYKISKSKSDSLVSKISNDILALEGMTSARTRHFYNNMLEFSVPGRLTKYLEIGSWKGSSLISSLYLNSNVDAVCIDDWSEFNGPRNEFLFNCEKFIEKNSKLKIIEMDCFSVFMEDKFDIYLYDGNHSYESHFKAINHFKNNLADSCLLIIDDWNWDRVRKGTEDALSKLDFEIKFKDEVYSRFNSDVEGYWNGMGIFVLEKS